jgi:hypothetical protein
MKWQPIVAGARTAVFGMLFIAVVLPTNVL